MELKSGINQMSINIRIDKQTLLYPYNKILHNNDTE